MYVEIFRGKSTDVYKLLCSVQFRHSTMSDSVTTWTVPSSLPCPSPTPRACSNSCPLCRWCHPTISSSVAPFSSCPQSFPASGSSPVSQLFTSGGQSIEASTSVLPVNIQDWFPLGLTGWISLQSKGLSRVFSNTTVRKHQFFGVQPSLWSLPHYEVRMSPLHDLLLRADVFLLSCVHDVAFLENLHCKGFGFFTF